MSGWRLSAYRKLGRALLSHGERWRKDPESRELRLPLILESLRSNAAAFQDEAPRAWVHAASAGELESIWPVARALAERGVRLVLSVFSRSAEPGLKKLAAECGENTVAFGFSPVEGTWAEALGIAKPRFFLTAKYEAWPELWAALGESRVPLILLGARMRSSLALARKVCLLLGGPLPRLVFLATDAEDEERLRHEFHAAEIVSVGDPRWDRVAARIRAGNNRAAELIRKYAALPRPWGVIGSAWREDLQAWGGNLDAFPGTIWVVPHETDEAHVAGIEEELLRWRPGPTLRTVATVEEPEGVRSILVNEKGFLSELYQAADWAFVGGGFGKGLHSTIEPALQGIPIAAGAEGADRFPEVRILSRFGQLTLTRDSNEIHDWLIRFVNLEAQARAEAKETWKARAESRLGATQRVIERLQPLL